VHRCQACGVLIGAVQVHGKWVPEQHWPSVIYPPRVPATKKAERSAVLPQEAHAGGLTFR
jgi:hypothetical protein